MTSSGKPFGIKELNIKGDSGTPTIQSVENLYVRVGVGSTVVIGNSASDFTSPAPAKVDTNNTTVLNVGIVTANKIYAGNVYGAVTGDAETATDLAGGATNFPQLVTQTAANTTEFLERSSNGNYILATNSTSTDFEWVEKPATGITAVTLTQYSEGTTDRSCSNPISVTNGSTIGIGSTSNAYGNKYVQSTEPTGSNLCEGDIWYDISGSGGSGGGGGGIGGITVQDEGTTLNTLATTLNFVGTGVTASNNSSDASTKIITIDTGVEGKTKVAIIKDQKNDGVSGGTFEEHWWRDRDLTVIEDPQSFVNFTAGGSVSVASTGKTPGYWSLPAGNYEIEWSAPGYDVNYHQSRLVWSTSESEITWQNGTLAGDKSADNNPNAVSRFDGSLCNGSIANASDNSDANIQTVSVGNKVISINQLTYFKIVHICSLTQNDVGFGASMTGIPDGYNGNMIYTQVKITDLKTAVKEGETLGTSKVATVKDVKGASVAGGTFTQNTWVVRDLNTISDPKSIGITSTGGNIISIPAGTYSIRWRAPAYEVKRNASRLIYSNSSTFASGNTTIMGTPAINSTEASVATDSTGVLACVTFTALTYLKIEHKCQFTKPTYGFGMYNDQGGDSIYTTIEIEDLKTAVKDTDSSSSFIAGMIMMYTGAFAPSGWVICDDSTEAVSAGAPDLRDKFIIGGYSHDGAWKTNVTGSLTQSGGSKDAIVGSHKHTFGLFSGGDDHGTSKPEICDDSGTGYTYSTTDAKDISTGDVIGETTDNKNLPPYYALCYIMKT